MSLVQEGVVQAMISVVRNRIKRFRSDRQNRRILEQMYDITTLAIQQGYDKQWPKLAMKRIFINAGAAEQHANQIVDSIVDQLYHSPVPKPVFIKHLKEMLS